MALPYCTVDQAVRIAKECGGSGNGSTYAQGDGINISQNIISVDSTISRVSELNNEVQARISADNNLSLNISKKLDKLTSESGEYIYGYNNASQTNKLLVTDLINNSSTLTNEMIPGAKAVIDAISSKDVEANVTLVGNESELISLRIGNTSYSNLNYHPFPDSFNTTGTLKEFGQSIVNYSGFATGCVWFGGLECSDLPGDMLQVECKVTALRDTTDFARNIAVIEIFSSNVPPYYWTYNTDSWEEGTGKDDWKYVASIDESFLNTLNASVGDDYNVKCKYVSAPASSKGWEFYLGKGVVANPTLSGSETQLTGLEVEGTKYKIQAGSEPSSYLSDASVTDNQLKIQNKLGQDVVNCSVNYELTNAKVKAVLSDTEKDSLTSGITSDMVVNTVYKTGEQEISATKTLTGSAKLGFKPQDNTNMSISAVADTFSNTLKLTSGNDTGTVSGSTELQVFYNYNTGRKIIMPAADGDTELGRTDRRFKTIFVSGAIKDGDTAGTNSITVADIVNKSTVVANTSSVSGASTAQSIKINGTDWNLPSGGTSAAWTACDLGEGFPYLPDYGTYEIRYFYNNVYYTFSSIYYDPAFACRSCMLKMQGQNKYLQLSINSSALGIYEVDLSTGDETDTITQESGSKSTKVYYRKVL